MPESERWPDPTDPEMPAPGFSGSWEGWTQHIDIEAPRPVLARHQRLRKALITGLCGEPFLWEAFERIAQQSGIADARAGLVAELEALAQTWGLPGRAALFVPDDGRTVGPPWAEVQRLWATFWNGIDFKRVLHHPEDKASLPLADAEAMEALRLAKAARLQAPSNLADLTDHISLRLHLSGLGSDHLRDDLRTLFLVALQSTIMDRPVTFRHDVAFTTPTRPTPPTRHVRDDLALNDREAVRAFLAGRAHARQDARVNAPPVGPSKRMPKGEGAHLDTWVRWLLEHRLHGKSLRQIARDDAAADQARGIAHEPNHRKVQHAIEEVATGLAPGPLMDAWLRWRRRQLDARRKRPATRKSGDTVTRTKATRKRMRRR